MIKHYVNETGTLLVLDTGILIGSAADQYIEYKKPSGVTGSFDADLYSSYSDLAAATGTYLLSHSLEYSDLDTPGEWRFHAFVAAVDGTWRGELVKINIFDVYE